jgi:hypothetical protein
MTVLNVLSSRRQGDEPQEMSVDKAARKSVAIMETEESDDREESENDDSVVDAVLQEANDRKQAAAAHEKSVLHKAWHEFQAFRKLCGRIVNSTRVQLFIVLLIAINAIMLGLATFDFVKDDPVTSHRFEVTDQVFLIIFTVELALQFIYHGYRLFLDGWLIFDFIIIVTSWAFAELQIVRAFRIFRAFRLITRVKVLQNLVTALFSVVPRIGAISLLLFLIFFIFAILMTSMWKDLPLDPQYFARLDATFFTLFQILTLDEWASVARDTMAEESWAWLPIIAFVIITAFIVINLIIAVICDAISALHADQRAMLTGGASMDEEDVAPSVDDIDIKKQLAQLEQQVEELARMQDQTMHSLQYLTRHLQSKKTV